MFFSEKVSSIIWKLFKIIEESPSTTFSDAVVVGICGGDCGKISVSTEDDGDDRFD